MHGDEDINREVLLRLCLELCSLGGGSGPLPTSYAVDAQLRPRMQALLANTRLHVIPSMNPDLGYAAAPKRFNANGEATAEEPKGVG
ncbi:MAG: M14 family zinc carboxypeptidase, partial [Flavobacterium sp.]|uniref:M14 family zinc carboxypeptidase n=1 Tax=Flavobacterium sp. TaxID=239 RepID=UPI0040332382